MGKRAYTGGRVALLCMLLAAGALLCALSACDGSHPNTYNIQASRETANYDPEASFAEDETHVSNRFTSELPVVVIDTRQVEGIGETSTTTTIKLLDNASAGLGTLSSTSSLEALIQTVPYGESSLRQKPDYHLSFTDGVSRSVFGAGENLSWFLLGGMYDKSLVRNYVGYTFAGMVMENVPQVKFCEVLLQDDEGYQYQGVYVVVGADIAPDTIAVQRTDEYPANPDHLVADTSLGLFKVQGYSTPYTTEQFEAASEAFYALDSTLQSEDTNFFLQYKQMLDSQSFAGWFVVNELLGNYSQSNSTVYYYHTDTQVISVLPIWNFERSLDNIREEPLNLRRLELQNAIIYEYLVLDSAFLDELTSFTSEHSALLNEHTLNEITDKAVLELGTAQMRDWFRWESVYNSASYGLLPGTPSTENFYETAEDLYDTDGSLIIEAEYTGSEDFSLPTLTRATSTYQEEIVRVKYFFDTRPSLVKKALPILKSQEDLLRQVNAYWQNTIYAGVFILVLMISIMIARRKALR